MAWKISKKGKANDMSILPSNANYLGYVSAQNHLTHLAHAMKSGAH